MSLTLHLGAHKTATTHFQKSLGLAAADLRQAGLFYAGPDDLRGDDIPMVNALNRAGRNGEFAAQAKQRLAELRAEYPALLLSDENMLGGTNRNGIFKNGQVYPEAAGRLARALAILGGQGATIALSLRDPAGFNVSAFSLQLTRGNELDLRDYLKGRDPAQLSWSDLVRRLMGVTGVKGVILWRYEDYTALRPRLLDRLLPEGMARAIPEIPPANVSMTQTGYDWLVAQAMADADADLRFLAREAWKRFPRSSNPALRLLKPEEYARSAENYARDIAELRQIPGVEFLDP